MHAKACNAYGAVASYSLIPRSFGDGSLKACVSIAQARNQDSYKVLGLIKAYTYN